MHRSYQYGPAGRFIAVTENSNSLLSNNEVCSRSNSYQYAGTSNGEDPEEVVALVNGGTTVATFQYDAIGNETGKCLGLVAMGVCSGESYAYVYDGNDQLRRATHFNSQGAATGAEEYWYGLDGQRTLVLKRDVENHPTELIWFIGDVEAHYDATSSNFPVSHVYSYLGLGGAVARVDRTADTEANIEYEFHGLAGSTLAAIDQATGTIGTSISYSPFGAVIEASDAGLEGFATHQHRWNDKYVDEVSKLAYYGTRFYDRSSLTWTQADPVYRFAPDARWADPRRGNLYTFSLNNPLRYVDPDGRDSRAPTPLPIDNSHYQSEFEIDNAQRADRIADSDWTVKFRSTPTVSSASIAPKGLGYCTPSGCYDPGEPIGPFDDFTDLAAHVAYEDAIAYGTFGETGHGESWHAMRLAADRQAGGWTLLTIALNWQGYLLSCLVSSGCGSAQTNSGGNDIPNRPVGGPGGPAPPSLPEYDGGKTVGVLRTGEGDVPLQSGWAGPAQSVPRGTPGFDIVTRTHVEGHAAAVMRTSGANTATLYINNPAICSSCAKLLPSMLPTGARLTVVTPSGSTAFIGK